MLFSSSQALRMFIEQSHDEVYGCFKGGSGNSGGKRLAISTVEEACLSEKRGVIVRQREYSSKRKNVSSKRKNVFVEEKRVFSSKRKSVFVEEKECFRRREMKSVLTNVVKRLE
ncbi:hypothetical protein Tco_0246761 [Tanacetum coccineum]